MSQMIRKTRLSAHEGFEPSAMRPGRPGQAPAAFADSPRQAAQRRQLTQLKGESQQAPPRDMLPESLRTGMQALSGIDLGQVQVHYNSSRPAQLQALAYAQGNEIHLGPGQEQHLAHEAWHLIQQRQGRVKATAEAGGVAINDNPGLEHEADRMGERARRVAPAQRKTAHASGCACSSCGGGLQLKREVTTGQAVHQRVQCSRGHENCPNTNHYPNGRVPTGRYKNTTGHHDPTIDKSRKRAVKKGYTGKRGKRGGST